jgi:hypothetical protein
VILEPLDLLARLAALVPPPRTHLARYHGVFAPHHARRAAVTPAGRGPTCRRCGGKLTVIASIEDPALIERILAHLERRRETEPLRLPFASRAPPQSSLF